MRASSPPSAVRDPIRGFVAFAFALVACGAAACGDSLVRAIDPGGTDGGLPLGAGGTPAEGATAFCQGSGAQIPLPGGAQCTGDLGHKLFRFAMCSCTTTTVSGKLRTDSFRSGGDAGPAGGGASLAANGAVSTNSHASIGGSIYAGGGQPALSLMGDGTIMRNVRAGGGVTSSGIFQIGADLFAAGDVGVTSGSLSVVGKVHLAPGRTATGVTAGGGTVTEAVSVAPPCDCTKPLDIAAIAGAFVSANDDAAAGVTPRSLDHPAKPLALPCGRYYFDTIAGGAVALSLSGRTAIFVGGNVSIDGGFKIDLAPGAELDLFVAKDLSITGTTAFGSVTAPAKVRVYTGGVTFDVSGDVGLGANLYAPNADVAVASNFEMSGAIYAKRIAFSGDFTIHYDESIVDVPGCQPPGTSCATCGDCAGATPACKNGTCAACVTDADCCAPLECSAGRCIHRLY